MYRLILFIIVTGVFLGHSHLSFSQATAYTEITDIAYYTGPEADTVYHKLNLVLPKGKANAPLLLWIGGGAWSYVDRHKEMDLARKFARQGVAVASVGHRLSPATWKDPALTSGIHHPEHIRDIARAFKWLYSHAAEYGYSQHNIFISGYSSGAHLATLLSLDYRYLQEQGLSINHLKGVIPVAGTYDIPHYYELLSSAYGVKMADSHVKAVFGTTHNDFLHASPTSYLHNLLVPVLLISEKDTYRYTQVFEDKIRKTAFNKLKVLHIDSYNHSELWKHISLAEQSEYREAIVNFIQTYTTL
jgi:acetyl esterase/lipase